MLTLSKENSSHLGAAESAIDFSGSYVKNTEPFHRVPDDGN